MRGVYDKLLSEMFKGIPEFFRVGVVQGGIAAEELCRKVGEKRKRFRMIAGLNGLGNTSDSGTNGMGWYGR